MDQNSQSLLSSGSLFAERYQIVKQIGEGGMGEVYLAHDRLLGDEQVALKILFAHLSKDAKHCQRFLREVQLTRKLSDINVVRTYDAGQFSGRLYLTMEFVSGVSLKEKLAQGSIDFYECAHIIQQIASGLKSVHDLGVIHRDLKPGNVLIEQSGLVKITDFGVARGATSDLTGTNEIVGSIAYLAPEIWLGKETTWRSDLYALGVLAYECSSGILPFDGGSAAEIMCKHLDSSAVEVNLINPQIPQWYSDLVTRLLQKDPDQRPSCAQEIATCIEQNLANLESNNDQKWQKISPENSLLDDRQLEASGDIFSTPVSLSPQDTYYGHAESVLSGNGKETQPGQSLEYRKIALSASRVLALSVALGLLIYFPINAVLIEFIRACKSISVLLAYFPLAIQLLAAAHFYLLPLFAVNSAIQEIGIGLRRWYLVSSSLAILCLLCSGIQTDNLARITISLRSGIINGSLPLLKEIWRNCSTELYWVCKVAGICS